MTRGPAYLCPPCASHCGEVRSVLAAAQTSRVARRERWETNPGPAFRFALTSAPSAIADVTRSNPSAACFADTSLWHIAAYIRSNIAKAARAALARATPRRHERRALPSSHPSRGHTDEPSAAGRRISKTMDCRASFARLERSETDAVARNAPPGSLVPKK